MEADEAPKFKIDLVPKHYRVIAELDASDAYDLIVSLRRFVDEFDAPAVTEELLTALESAYAGELPQRIDVNLLPSLDEAETEDAE